MNDKFFKGLLISFYSFIFIVFLTLFSFSVHAAGNSAVEYPLPYVVSNENVEGFSSFIDNLSRCNSSYAYYANRYINGDTCFGYDFYESGIHKFRLIFPESNFNYSFSLSTNYDSFDYTQNRAEMTISGFSFITGYVEVYNNRYYFYGGERVNYPNTLTLSFFNGTNKGDGSILVPNISTQNFNYDDDENKPVFGFGRPTLPPINTGHADQAEFDPDDDLTSTGHAQQPSIPSFPQMPSVNFDLTSVETLLESIFNLVKEFADFIGECFSVFFSWLVDVIQNAVQSIINTIKSLASFLYNNFLNLFEAFFGLFENLFNIIDDIYQHGLDDNGNFSIVVYLEYLFVPDPDDVVQILIDNDEFGFIPAMEHLFDVWSDFITTVHSLTYNYYITLPKFTLMNKDFGPYNIDFSWYLDYKVIVDGIISAFLILGYLYWLYTRFAGILRGSSGSIYDENKGDPKKAG